MTETNEISFHTDMARGEGDEHVLFCLGEETYGISLLQVREILAGFQLTRIPDAPACCLGIISVRSQPVPLVSLRQRFALPEAPVDRKTRAITVECEPNVIALMVDEVKTVTRIPVSAVHLPPKIAKLDLARYVRGVWPLADDKFAILLNVDEVLTSEERIEIARVVQAIHQGDNETPAGGADHEEQTGTSNKRRRRSRPKRATAVEPKPGPQDDASGAAAGGLAARVRAPGLPK